MWREGQFAGDHQGSSGSARVTGRPPDRCGAGAGGLRPVLRVTGAVSSRPVASFGVSDRTRQIRGQVSRRPASPGRGLGWRLRLPPDPAAARSPHRYRSPRSSASRAPRFRSAFAEGGCGGRGRTEPPHPVSGHRNGRAHPGDGTGLGKTPNARYPPDPSSTRPGAWSPSSTFPTGPRGVHRCVWIMRRAYIHRSRRCVVRDRLRCQRSGSIHPAPYW